MAAAAQLTGAAAAASSCLSGQTVRLLPDRWERAAGTEQYIGSSAQMKEQGRPQPPCNDQLLLEDGIIIK